MTVGGHHTELVAGEGSQASLSVAERGGRTKLTETPNTVITNVYLYSFHAQDKLRAQGQVCGGGGGE